MKKIISTLLYLTILLTACTGTTTPAPTAEPATVGSAPGTIIAEGKLLPARAVELSFVQPGVIAEVLVDPGDLVAAGEPLARLVGLETVLAELAAAQLEQTLTRQALEALKRNALLTASQAEKTLLDAQKAYDNESNGWNTGNKENAGELDLTIDDYVTAEQDYRTARDKLIALLNKDQTNRERMDAQDDLNREQESLTEAYTDLQKAVGENNHPLDEKQTQLLAAIANLEIARDLQARLEANNLDPEKLAAAEANLKAAEAHVTAAEAAVAHYELRAPTSGKILSTENLTTGEAAVPGQPAAFLADTATWIVETKDLAEIDISRVALDQSVTVKLDAFPGEEFTGKVSAIDPVGREYLGDMTYKVTITMNAADPRFLWNMTATVTISQ